MTQAWNHLLFAHWSLPADVMRRHVPLSLDLDLYKGKAWLAVTPFFLNDLAPRLGPAFPGLSEFPELNVRTYVTYRGVPGVFFFSLDAGSWPAVIGARLGFGLPYFRANMTIERSGDEVAYRSRRRGSGRATQFLARYRPTSAVRTSAPGSLEYFLTERYCLYAIRGKSVWRAHIHHKPWPLQAASAQIEVNTMADAAGIELPATPPLLHFAHRIEVLVWPPKIVSG